MTAEPGSVADPAGWPGGAEAIASPAAGHGPRRGLGPLGRRLLAAFVAVALSSVLVLSLAALVGTGQGLAAAQRAERTQLADRAAALVAEAYLAAEGWRGADLAPARAAADAAGARLVVTGAGGEPVRPGHGGPGMHHVAGAPDVSAPVVVGGERVGTVHLSFSGGSFSGGVPAGRTVAWSWVAVAGAVALLVALAASWFVTRRLTTPLVTLAGAARRFAAGDRGARAGVRAPGELGEVVRAFDGMADQVVHTEAVRRRLAADVAHELRTPLAGLRAGLEEVRDGLAPADPARLAALHDQALRLGRVVEDLSQLASAEAAAFSLRRTEVDLAELVGAAVAAQEPMLRAAGLSVHRDLRGPVPVRVDADRIHQAVVNLLTNAARYCRPGDRVAVRVSQVDGAAVVVVSDTGPGIAADDLPHVFQRFRRGRGAERVSGSGIGLAVVRELVTAHGGTVTAASPPGAGARFTIRLPLHPVSTPATPVLHRPEGS